MSQRYQRIVGEAPSTICRRAGFTDKLPTERTCCARPSRPNPASAPRCPTSASLANVDVQRANYCRPSEFRANTGMDKNLRRHRRNYPAPQVLLNWNLFKGGADEARIRQSHEQLYNATDLRDKACRDIRQQTAIAWNDVKKPRSSWGTRAAPAVHRERPATPTASSSTSASAACSTCSTPRTNSSRPRRQRPFPLRSDPGRAARPHPDPPHPAQHAARAPVAKQGPEEASLSEPAEDEAVQCSTDPVRPALDTDGAHRPQPRSCRRRPMPPWRARRWHAAGYASRRAPVKAWL